MDNIHWYQRNINRRKPGVRNDVRPPILHNKTQTYPLYSSPMHTFPHQVEPLLAYQQAQRHNQQRKRRNNLVAAVVMALTLLGSGGVVFLQLSKTTLERVYAGAETGQNHLIQAKDALLAQDFTTAIAEFSQAKGEFADAASVVDPFAKIPLSSKIQSAYALLRAGEYLAVAGEKACGGIVPLYELLTSTNGQYGLDLTTGKFLKEAMVTFSAVQPELRDAYTRAKEAERLVGEVDITILDGAMQDRLAKLKLALPPVVELLELTYSASQFMPQLLGKDTEQRYMILFQNNNELRSTGGFLGGFSTVVIADAALKEMYAKNVYDIEGQLKEYVEPPEPLKNQWPHINWGMRDCLWDPDFQTSIPLCHWFYQRATSETVDGFFGITPNLVKNILQVLGPLDIWANGQTITVTAENFVETIDDQERKVPEGADPRKFLIDLSDVVFKRLLEVKKEQWPTLASMFRISLEQKDLLLYFSNPQANQYILEKNWGGALTQEKGDYLAIFDANINGSKSSQLIDVEYNLAITVASDGSMQHKLTMVYQHNGTAVLPSAPTRNFTRVYVPQGSTLISSLGTKEGVTQVAEAHDRTVFSDYINIKPGEMVNITYIYETPLTVGEEDLTSYVLNIQKQPGTSGHNLRFSLNLPPTLKAVSTEKKINVTSDNSVWFFEKLEKDMQFDILVKRL